MLYRERLAYADGSKRKWRSDRKLLFRANCVATTCGLMSCVLWAGGIDQIGNAWAVFQQLRCVLVFLRLRLDFSDTFVIAFRPSWP